MNGTATGNPETRFDRGARLLLLFALLFIALDIAQLAYRFTLPTEGWAIDTNSNEAGDYNFYIIENIVGAPSPLQPGDALHVVGGVPAEKISNGKVLFSPPPEGWRAGSEVPVTVIRDGQELTFDIPIVNWTFAAWLRANFTGLERLISWLNTLIIFGVGLFTFLKRPGNLSARFLFLFGLASLAMLNSGFLPDGLGVLFSGFAAFGKAVFSYVIFAYLFGPALLGFALTFPRPKAIIHRRPWLLLIPFMIGSIAPVLLFIKPSLAAVGFPITLGMVLAAIAGLMHSALTMRDAISRAQLRWAVGGVVLGLGLFLLNYPSIAVTGFLRQTILLLANMGLPVMSLSLAVAILRYRLYDIDLVIRRTLVYSLLTILLALVYSGSVTVLQGFFTTLGGSQSTLATVISTLAIAALFNPLRRRIQEIIDQRFYRQKYDAEQALALFNEAARSETDLQALVNRLVSVVTETTQPENVLVWLDPMAERRRTISEAAPTPAGKQANR